MLNWNSWLTEIWNQSFLYMCNYCLPGGIYETGKYKIYTNG
jgi:hypothetical protein